ncbi:ketopantoate hydroxymethyltransferase [Abditibacterium utsteinense]|uniref:3-methyl-2-oxobutanoate hydroxymethyltransferase n=1 Tax=Abditibacterium utsteinense TaxID=1960156 RepID=A0A2S8SU30_9BACT|nr:3-methyl-2-oxobutanoate hydroxymethyltransferase [Abditibacterium utsteinense]PQV64249.1 ketopantoate hydroxymethyltransferase [Abditibacterium utsteinense]
MSSLRIFARKKQSQIPLAMIALSDAPAAQIACDAGIDAILVGDSLGNTALGFDSTIPVTLDMMAHHLGAVVRGVKSSSRPAVPIVADMPFGSYATPEIGVQNAVRLIQLGAHAVKIEGTQGAGNDFGRVFELCQRAGIPVMGHIGFTPQSELQFENVVQGKTARDAAQLLQQALTLQRAGCFALVLEAMTIQVARQITSQLSISTVGIGAGKDCNGQVLVWHDLVGITAKPFKMARAFASTREIWTSAIQSYCAEIEAAQFPTAQNGWEMSEEESQNWAQNLAKKNEFENSAEEIEKLDEQPF